VFVFNQTSAYKESSHCLHKPIITMASVTFDCEFMKQQSAAVAVPNSANFSVVFDENQFPMVFSAGTDGVLYLVRRDQSNPSANLLVNLSQRLKVRGKVVAVKASQDRDGTLYVVYAESFAPDRARVGVLAPIKTGTYKLFLKL
jgi:hypothetical protein